MQNKKKREIILSQTVKEANQCMLGTHEQGDITPWQILLDF